MKPADNFYVKCLERAGIRTKKLLIFKGYNYNYADKKISEIDYINLKRCTMKQKS